MNIQPGSGIKGRKVAQVLKGAREVFLRDGFEGASVDEIARAAGVSKATLYSYFPDKRMLFIEVAKGECLRQAEGFDEMLSVGASAREGLYNAARGIMSVMVSGFGRNVFRVCVAESERFPEIGRNFWDSGPGLARGRLIAFFQSLCDRGELKIDDLELAADQFVELCKTRNFAKLILCIQDDFTEAELDRVAQGAVDMFLARYGTG